MSFIAEKEAAMRWINEIAEHLPEHLKPNLAHDMRRLEDELSKCRSNGSREVTVIGWRQEVGSRIAQRLAHAALPPGLRIDTGGTVLDVEVRTQR